MKSLVGRISIPLILVLMESNSAWAGTPYHPVAAVQTTNGSAFVLTSEGTILATNFNLASGSVTGHFSFPVIGYVSDMVYGNVGGQILLFVASASSIGGVVQGRVEAFTTDGRSVRTWMAPHIVVGLAFDFSTQTIYFASGDSPEIYGISADGGGGSKFVAEVSGASKLGSLAIDYGRGMLYVSDLDQGDVYSLDLRTKRTKVLARVGVPQALSLAGDGLILMVADSARRQVVSISLNSTAPMVKAVTPSGSFKTPSGLAWWDATHLIVADEQKGTLSFVEITSGRIVFAIPLQL